ncbi:hypothetical protein CBW65_23590 [Tumebacillus avium]|uniref:FAD-binding domain-containing protein n=1 Tax=Tumebacillus avium TaxID=1903704 RepID=A0A1Y0IST0_9BACL|nr:FAD-dependent monooxygenase [Tumebacillus avium]ARU63668.1 hypothetical protein CBW65_23590 [Tumebacillus avium]
MKSIQTDVCIAGGGPAGMLLGLLLAKQGVNVLVLEMHKQFEREFRGEVLQTRFVQMMQQLGLWSELEQQTHVRLAAHDYYRGEERIARVEFADLNAEVPFAAWMPQPVLLGYLQEKAQAYPSFSMWFDAQVKELLQDDTGYNGVLVEHAGEQVEVRARVTIGADGRFSTIRRLGGFEYEYEHHESDYLWFICNMPSDWPASIRLVMTEQRNYILFPRYPDQLQAGIMLPKGQWKQITERGVDALREELRAATPALADFAETLSDFKPFHLLQARQHFVKEWAQDGLLLIGDAAHCALPAGAVGVSLAAATAILAAQVITEALAAGDVSKERLSRLQQQREAEVREIHQTQWRMGGRPPQPGSGKQPLPNFAAGLKKVFVMEKALPVQSGYTF